MPSWKDQDFSPAAPCTAAFAACLFVMSGCSHSAGERPASPQDADGDGYLPPEDCDDADPQRHPGATETCDGVDNDCSGWVDDDAVDAEFHYRDRDGDGFGAEQSPTRECVVPDGWVRHAGDCDDASPERYPGAQEQCNGHDDDCDGEVDAPSPTGLVFCYADWDGDGFGVEPPLGEACSCDADETSELGDCDDTDPARFPGASEIWYDGVDQDCLDDDDFDADRDGYPHDEYGGSDCDDTRPGVHPGAEEVCGNGLDDDCAGLSPVCGSYGPLRSVDAAWSLSGSSASYVGAFGRLAPLDHDGDGMLDLAVSARRADTSQETAGAVWVFEGPVTAHGSLTHAVASGTGSTAGGQFGAQLLGAELDGDGYDDLVILSLAHADESYTVHGFSGPLTGTLELSTPRFRLSLSEAWSLSLSGSRDLTGDGCGNFVVADSLWSAELDQGGSVWLFGDLHGDGRTTDDAEVQIVGTSAGLQLGTALASDGDLNGDGFADLVVGAVEGDEIDSGTDHSVLHVFYGPVSAATSDDSDLLVVGDTISDNRPWRVVSTAADYNGDGFDDLLYISLYADAGATGSGFAWVASGPVAVTTDLATTAARIDGVEPNATFARPQGNMDLNGDGRSDILLSSYRAPNGRGDGVAYVHLGPISGVTNADAGAAVIGGQSSESFGEDSVGLGDQTGDGFDDFIVSASSAAGRTGALYLFAGGAGE